MSVAIASIDVTNAGSDELISEFPPISENARITLESRYLDREDGKLTEDPDGLFRRVAKAVAEAEEPKDRARYEDLFFTMMRRFEFMPNSPCLMNAGRKLGALCACYVLPIPDNMEGIMQGAVDTAMIQRSGGGTGFSLDDLRPSGSYISSSGGTTSGPISFWRMYSEVTHSIQQGCVIGGTLIPTADGVVAIKDLVGQMPFVFTYDPSRQRIAVMQATSVFKTKSNAAVWKLKTDKGLVLFATPDHLILCRDGVDRRLDELKPGMRLMPLTRYIKDHRVHVTLQDGHDTRIRQSRLMYADTRNIDLSSLTDVDIHHIDGDMLNDHPENLDALSRSEHMKIHGTARADVVKTWATKYPKHGAKNGMHGSKFYARKSEVEINRFRASISEGLSRCNPMRNPEVAKHHPLFNNNETKTLAKRGKIVRLVRACLDRGIDVSSAEAWDAHRGFLPNHFQYKSSTILSVFSSWDELTAHVQRCREYATRKDGLIECCAAVLNAGLDISSDDAWDESIRQFPEFPGKLYGSKSVRRHFGSVQHLQESLSCVNHIVEEVSFSHHEDVYDMTVPGAEHFAVVSSEAPDSCGIVIHNSFRRGANMSMMNVRNPDILKFLFAKQNLAQFVNYNISIKITDSFIHALKSDPFSPHRVFDHHRGGLYVIPVEVLGKVKAAVQRSIDDSMAMRALDNCYGINELVRVDDRETPQGKFVSVKDIWKILVEHAHKTGEPGVCFIDRIRETEPTPHVGLIETSNPCGEAFLLANEACVLGSVALNKFVSENRIDWDGLEKCVRLGVRFLDNVITVTKFPTQSITDMVRGGNRKIGLGVMGLADALFALGLPYNSERGVAMAESLMQFISKVATQESIDLATARGPFPNWNGSRPQRLGEKPRRNAEVLSIAPTGTISIIANCSCGIEPIFSLAFQRNVLEGKQLIEAHKGFEEIARREGFWRDDLPDEIMKRGSIQHLDFIPKKWKEVFVCAHDVSPEWHVRMQAAVQRHTSNAVSKTINLPHDATVDDVATAYLLAHELKCKAVTVYRDGSRQSQPMQLKNDAAPDQHSVVAESPALNIRDDGEPIPAVPDLAHAIRIRQLTAFGHLHATIVHDAQGNPLEIFAQCGANGDVAQADLEGLCRLSSLLLRAGYPAFELVKQLLAPGASLQGLNLPKALATILIKFLEAKAAGNIFMSKSSASGHNGSSNGNGNGKLHSSRFLNDDPAVNGYKIRCPSGNPSCRGAVLRNGTCVTCATCGASTCS